MHVVLPRPLGFHPVNFFQVPEHTKLLLGTDLVLCACDLLNILHSLFTVTLLTLEISA